MGYKEFYFRLVIISAMLLAACGGALKLGAFLPITKTEGDAPFIVAAPESKSPVAFVFTSNNPAVATVEGNKITLGIAGTTTITASQEERGTWSATSARTTLTVLPLACVAPAIRQAGVCTASNATSGNFITHSGRTWAPITLIDTWANAIKYCTTTTIRGLTNWRAPGAFELVDLSTSGLINGQGWVLARTWSSSASLDTSKTVIKDLHDTVDLSSGRVSSQSDLTGAYVACVR